ncbi:hypothetical protein [Falsiruegeria mediterranea]|uniref:Uncharacterized protein n=1 Tax=Falsiruegeria mediterranea M17 TaxID=1200281 RepID=A0A2R8C5C4_9RHOB|nr:hypothetical protein [Falsiruegeria mediterranea]SPJ27620.1 hypothetical protein TRM7615_01110 [Falsiruegeria mediterranea M17]
MNIIEAMVVSEASITYSNLPALDHPAYAAGVSYAKGDRICAAKPYKVGVVDLVGQHVFESLQDNNQGNDPSADDGSNWLVIGPTNRLRAFDGTIGSGTSHAGSVEFKVQTDRTCDALAFFGLRGGTVRVRVYTSQDALIWDKTFSLFDPIEVSNQFDFWFAEREFARVYLVTGLPRGGNRFVHVTVDAGTGTAEIGAMVLGTQANLGITRPGTTVDFRDFSELNEDQYGNIAPVARQKIRLVNYRFSYETENTERILRRVMRNSGRLVVAYQALGTERYGTLVYGLINDLELPGEAVFSDGQLEMRGVVE